MSRSLSSPLHSRPPTRADLLAAALSHAARGWSIIPIASDKKPPKGFRWKPFQRARAAEDQLREAFDRDGVTGLAVVLGAVSGDLAVADFDSEAVYADWPARHDELAATLPTVKTGRGYHVYFRAAGAATCNTWFGELRAAGAYVVLPPSLHPSGLIYRWLREMPPGGPPALPAYKSVLARANAPSLEPVAQGSTSSRQKFGGNSCESRASEKIGAGSYFEEEGDWSPQRPQTHRHGFVGSEGSVVSGDSVASVGTLGEGETGADQFDALIAQAINDSIPEGPCSLDPALFVLLRRLKAVPRLEHAQARDIMPYIERWAERARHLIDSADHDSLLAQALHSWPRVKYPHGRGELAMYMDRARSRPLPPEAERYANTGLRELVSLCTLLQEASSPRPFYLAQRSAGEALGCDKKTAGKWIELLIHDGVLMREFLGRTGRASEYRFVPFSERRPNGYGNSTANAEHISESVDNKGGQG